MIGQSSLTCQRYPPSSYHDSLAVEFFDDLEEWSTSDDEDECENFLYEIANPFTVNDNNDDNFEDCAKFHMEGNDRAEVSLLNKSKKADDSSPRHGQAPPAVSTEESQNSQCSDCSRGKTTFASGINRTKIIMKLPEGH